MPTLANPEPTWASPARAALDLAAVVTSRIGSAGAPVMLLPGGLANLNIRVGREWVLRVYERDPAALAKERLLLERGWQRFRVPRIVDHGADYLLLEHIELRPLRDSADHGESVGAAAAEIHGVCLDTSGVLGPDLAVTEPLPDLRAYVEGRMVELGPEWQQLRTPIVQALQDVDSKTEVSRAPVLNHGDFKPSNLFLGPSNELVVLDWSSRSRAHT